ncbi:retrotransposon protein, partial [Striga asiatica]
VLGNEFCIQVEARCFGDKEWMWVTMVYLSNDKSAKKEQWRFLKDAQQNWGEVWAIAGDWNDICSNEEKRGGRQRSASSFNEFNAFIAHMGMQELHQCGSFFTWGNNRDGEGYIEERLDKIFVSLGWMQQLPGTRASNLNGADTNISDFNWVPGIRVGQPRIRISGLEVNLKVKDLLSNGGTTWDQTLVKALFEEEDAAKIMLIDTLNPALPDRISCKFAVKGNFSVSSLYSKMIAGKVV